MNKLLNKTYPVQTRPTICMNDAADSGVEASLSDHLFNRLREFIYSHTGISLQFNKKTMLEGRLLKRMRVLGLISFRKYCEYLFSSVGMKQELTHLIDVVTTNKTDFFREPSHFSFLSEIVLPELSEKIRQRADRTLKIWSAGCSSGEEPYTLGMYILDYTLLSLRFDFSILATDISTQVLDKAKKGIYTSERIAPIPLNLRRKYLLRSKDRNKNIFRIVPALRHSVKFRRLNFMDDDFGISDTMDIIFCRNVLIYFDKKTQERLLRKFCGHLSPGGYVFIGHSETLSGMNIPLVQVASTIYKKLP